MKTLAIIILMVIISSCELVKQDFIDPRLQKHYDQFYTEAYVRGHNPPRKEIFMEITDNIPDHLNGHADWRKNSTHIKIKRSFYEENIDRCESCIERLVFHEMGHGILGRHHWNETYDSLVVQATVIHNDTLSVSQQWISVASSIMIEGNQPVNMWYERDRKKYLDELFR